MKQSLENIELIESYYEGLLVGAELERVRMLLATDPVFFEEYNLYLKLVQGIKSSDEVEIKSKLKIIDFDIDNRPKIHMNGSNPFVSFLGYKKNFRIAAILVLFILSSAYIGYVSFFSTQAIFKKYYVEELGLPVLMGENRNLKLDEAMNFYKTGDFKSAYSVIQELYLLDSENDTLQYFSGVLLLKLSNSEKASAFFTLGANNLNSNFHKDSEYRLAVSLFQSDHKTEAKNLFQKIATDGGNQYSQSAADLLKNLY